MHASPEMTTRGLLTVEDERARAAHDRRAGLEQRPGEQRHVAVAQLLARERARHLGRARLEPQLLGEQRVPHEVAADLLLDREDHRTVRLIRQLAGRRQLCLGEAAAHRGRAEQP